ncbi:protein of unknown function [Xenorhabdus bovienii]|uniref:Uncharacterized protein n=1 Tax=Xenorhabdus bovienii TaxID=40576 RepID=A0A0B6XBN5_XENBV|nr:protein of unknown function [Xenorhabdus bovienii]
MRSLIGANCAGLGRQLSVIIDIVSRVAHMGANRSMAAMIVGKLCWC